MPERLRTLRHCIFTGGVVEGNGLALSVKPCRACQLSQRESPWHGRKVSGLTAKLAGVPAPKEPNLQARMNALRRQVEEMVEQKGEFVAMPQARAQTMHYMKGLKGAAALRRYCCTLTHLEDLDELIAAVFEEQRKAGLDPDDVREVPFP